jgi:hypothetical protein
MRLLPFHTSRRKQDSGSVKIYLVQEGWSDESTLVSLAFWLDISHDRYVERETPGDSHPKMEKADSISRISCKKLESYY